MGRRFDGQVKAVTPDLQTKHRLHILAHRLDILRMRGVTLEFHGVRKSGSRIVLTHVPNLADRAAEYGPGLILAGHTHGGHVKIGSLTEKIAARFGNRYLAGFYGVKEALLYVNCGIGSSSVPIRAGAPSECAIFTLRAPKQPR